MGTSASVESFKSPVEKGEWTLLFIAESTLRLKLSRVIGFG